MNTVRYNFLVKALVLVSTQCCSPGQWTLVKPQWLGNSKVGACAWDVCAWVWVCVCQIHASVLFSLHKPAFLDWGCQFAKVLLQQPCTPMIPPHITYYSFGMIKPLLRSLWAPLWCFWPLVGLWGNILHVDYVVHEDTHGCDPHPVTRGANKGCAKKARKHACKQCTF